jgi:hypothetical protein
MDVQGIVNKHQAKGEGRLVQLNSHLPFALAFEYETHLQHGEAPQKGQFRCFLRILLLLLPTHTTTTLTYAYYYYSYFTQNTHTHRIHTQNTHTLKHTHIYRIHQDLAMRDCIFLLFFSHIKIPCHAGFPAPWGAESRHRRGPCRWRTLT